MSEPPPSGPPPHGGGPYGPPYPGYPPPYPQPGPWPGPAPYAGAYGPQPPHGSQQGRALPSYPHAQPEPYHRILRTHTYHWWRVLIGLPLAVTLAFLSALLVGLLVAVAVASVVELFGLGSADAVFQGLTLTGDLTPPTLLIVNLSLAGLIPVTWLTVRYLHHLRPRWLGSVRPGLRWRLLGLYLGAAVLSTFVAYVLSAFLLPAQAPGSGAGQAQSTATTAAFLVVIALSTPLQSAGEEYLFRGYLLQGFGALVRAPWFALVCTSLLFATAHGSQNLALFVDRFAFGLVAGGLVMFTGGLEVGIALHVVNNLLVLGLSAATGTLSEALQATEASWSLVAFDIGQFVLYAALVVLLCRWRRPQATTSGPPATG
jgi:uncharacterized protein